MLSVLSHDETWADGTYFNSMFFIDNRVRGRGRMMAVLVSKRDQLPGFVIAHLTCSLMSSVSPTSELFSHLPRNSSPRNGLSGFFSLPSFSLRVQYCWCNVLRNHLSTASALRSGSGSRAGAMKSSGCSAQYAEYSVRDVEDKINGGAVKDERSPLKEAMDWGNVLLAH